MATTCPPLGAEHEPLRGDRSIDGGLGVADAVVVARHGDIEVRRAKRDNPRASRTADEPLSGRGSIHGEIAATDAVVIARYGDIDIIRSAELEERVGSARRVVERPAADGGLIDGHRGLAAASEVGGRGITDRQAQRRTGRTDVSRDVVLSYSQRECAGGQVGGGLERIAPRRDRGGRRGYDIAGRTEQINRDSGHGRAEDERPAVGRLGFGCRADVFRCAERRCGERCGRRGHDRHADGAADGSEVSSGIDGAGFQHVDAARQRNGGLNGVRTVSGRVDRAENRSRRRQKLNGGAGRGRAKKMRLDDIRDAGHQPHPNRRWPAQLRASRRDEENGLDYER